MIRFLYKVELWNPTNRNVAIYEGECPSDILVWAETEKDAKQKASKYYLNNYRTSGEFKIFKTVE